MIVCDQITDLAPTLRLPVFLADDFVVTEGANFGDEIGAAAALEPGDIYTLNPGAAKVPVAVFGDTADQLLLITDCSAAGRPGASLHLDCCATFMCPDGNTAEAMVLVETLDSLIEATYLLPLAPIEAQRNYTLIHIETGNLQARLSELAAARIARGTQITLADGSALPVENLSVGDRIRTRDNGAQAIRSIGSQTLRAAGAQAPVLITKGTFGNGADLLVGPEHRVLVRETSDRPASARSGAMVRARQLINGDSVVQEDAGQIDYFQLSFDRSQTIYAEGIATAGPLAEPSAGAVIVADFAGQPVLAPVQRGTATVEGTTSGRFGVGLEVSPPLQAANG